MPFYLLILFISLSLESIEIQEIPLYGKIIVKHNSNLYLNTQNLKSSEKAYFKLFFNNGNNYDEIYIFEGESNDYNESSFGYNLAKIYPCIISKLNFEYTLIFEIPLTKNGKYLLIQIPEFSNASNTLIEVEHRNNNILNLNNIGDIRFLDTKINSTRTIGDTKINSTRTIENTKNNSSNPIENTKNNSTKPIENTKNNSTNQIENTKSTTSKAIDNTKRNFIIVENIMFWIIVSIIAITVIIFFFVIICCCCIRRSSETVGIIDSPLIPAYQVQPSYVQPTYVQPVYAPPYY